MADSLYSIDVQRITGEKIKLDSYRNKILLIVNTASQCGFTSQYAGLQKLYEDFNSKGFEILGFPCNQFGGQEPGSDADVKSFCDLNYKVSFPMFSKIEVNGAHTHPLYAYLKSHAKGVLGTEAIKWNFTKFLVNQKGEVIDRFAPTTTPEGIRSEIKKILI
jgi:glutathione peroxidase